MKTLEEKIKNKLALQEELGWIPEPKRPVVCIPSGMTEALGGKLFEQMIEGLQELPIELVVLGRGSEKYGKMLTQLAKTDKHRVAIMSDDEDSLRKMLAGSDIALFFAPVSKAAELDLVLRYGVVPVAMPTGHLENYNPVQEAGNSFLYESATMWQCYGALVRALETFKFPYDWRTIQRHAMETSE